MNTSNGNFRVMFPGKAMEFTGERITTAIDGRIEFEHFHRYCLARDFCNELDVLDIASGEGYGSAILAGVARRVVSVDIDAGSVTHAEESYGAENLRFLQGGALNLPLDDASVDVVVSFETLEHVREHARFVAEVRRVLRPGGLFIVSTPDRTVYSARCEHFNLFHLLELAEPEFASLLRANFVNAIILSQRAILGSVIAAREGGGPWRSYERRAPEYIEASSGLARAPYLIGLASDAALPPVHSSAYIDWRSADEVVRNFMRAPGLEARAVERDAARAALADAELGAAERERVAARTKAEAWAPKLKAERDAADAIRASLQSEISRQSEHSDHLARELTRAYKRPWRPIKHFIHYYLLAALSVASAPFSGRAAERFAHSAQKRSPRRYDKFLGSKRDAAESGVNPLRRHAAGAPPTTNTTQGRKSSKPPSSPTPYPVKQVPSFWYYIGDTLDWLDAHSQLTGVGRVSTELFFASRHNCGLTKVWPCIFGRSPSRLVEMTDADRVRFLAQRTGLAVDEAIVEVLDPSIPHPRGPESGDHVFFTGLVWTPTFTDLFIHLARRKIDFSVIVYDIIPIEKPDLVGDEYFRSFSNWLATTLDTARLIYVSSIFVQEQIVRWALLTGVEIKAQILVIPFGLREIPSALSPSELAGRPQTANVDLKGFVLSVGTIDRRKNQIFLCSIWKQLANRLGVDEIPQLVLVGRDDIRIGTVDPTLSSLFAEAKILVLQDLSDTVVAGLYKSCLFTAFSSISEGYGLPVAESLLYGKLCLSSDLPPIREHAHDLVWYFDPEDIAGAVDLFVRAIDQPEERKRAETRILREFSPTKWADSWRTILPVAQRSLPERVVRFSEAHAPAFPGIKAVQPNQALANARRWCSSDNPEVSILILNWNSAALTRECVRQIWANTDGYEYEIVIVDNGSSPDDVDRLRNLGLGIRLVELGCNRFFGEANNIAAEASRGRFLCILNNDAFVQPGWLSPLISPLAADPQVGATGPLFLYLDGTIQEAGGVLDAGGYPFRLGRGEKQPSSEILKPRFVDYISAAALLVPRDLFMEVGGFDLAYEPIYYEDADLCLKIQASGRKILYCSESRVTHIEGSSANGDPVSEARRKALGDLNRDKFVARWGQYLRTRDPKEFPAFRPDFPLPCPAAKPAAQNDKEKTAAVYTPYALTPGGGERYLLSLAVFLAKNYVVTIVTPHPYSLLRLRNLGQEFGLDLSGLRTSTEADFAEAPIPHLQVTMGNHVIPPVPARGTINIFLCQFPFPMPEQLNPIDRAMLAKYDKVLVYSKYAARHFYGAISALQLPPLAVRIVNPPVPQILRDCGEKLRTILSVGRFFVGGHSKRHDVLIAAFKSICDKFDEPVELHLAGSSTPGGEHMDYLASLKASAEGYPIYFHVNCSSDELRDLYCAALVYWHGTGIGADLTARPEEAEHFGISIVEAMSAQAIPFALNSGGPREIIDDGETGFLFDSVENMVRLTLEIFSKEERPRAERIMAAAELRAQDFAIENFEREIEALLREFN